MELENAKLCAQIIIPWISTNSQKLYQFNDFVQDYNLEYSIEM